MWDKPIVIYYYCFITIIAFLSCQSISKIAVDDLENNVEQGNWVLILLPPTGKNDEFFVMIKYIRFSRDFRACELKI